MGGWAESARSDDHGYGLEAARCNVCPPFSLFAPVQSLFVAIREIRVDVSAQMGPPVQPVCVFCAFSWPFRVASISPLQGLGLMGGTCS
jgi:hypothetical protein